MPQRDTRAFLEDIRVACDRLVEATSQADLATYRADWKLRSIVERQFSILGEALSQLLRLNPALEPRIRDARRIVNFRNLLIHGYHIVDDITVWGILQDDVPRLRADIATLDL